MRSFKKKCLGKMSEVAGGGRTILFVSHNMAAVETLCPRTIHLATRVLQDGKTDRVVASYLDRRHSRSHHARPYIQQGLALESVKIGPSVIRTGDAVDFEFTFRAEGPGQIRECAVLIYSLKGFRVAVVDVRECGGLPFAFDIGYFVIRARVAELAVVEGIYTAGLYILANAFAGNLLELEEFAVAEASSSDNFVPYHPDHRGVVVLKAETSLITRDFPAALEAWPANPASR
jgi:lipopolysaccharide transport system ATP-binding protein